METDHSLVCRAAVKLAPNAAESNEIVYLPQGLHEITPSAGGIGKPIKVLVDAAAARETEKRRLAIIAAGKRPYFDLNHDDREASFWPKSFFWREGEGVIAAGEWSGSGKRGVAEKDYWSFSPIFHVDNKHANPARVVCREDQQPKPNMGGLVNDPAFENLPLWAKNAGASGGTGTNQNGEPMNEQELAELRAKNKELEKKVEELEALVAKDKHDQLSAARLEQAKAELRATQAELKAAELESKNKSQADIITARYKSDAEAAVKAAVERGAIAAKDTKTQDTLVAKATDDPTFIEVIRAMQGNAALLHGRITPSPNGADPKARVTNESPNTIIKAFYDVIAKNAKLRLTEHAKEKSALAREAAAIFAKDIDKNEAVQTMSIEDAIVAADVTDTAIGLLAGSLVLQRALPLMQYEYPVLGSFTQDFSGDPGLFQQTEVTRIVMRPAVQTYDPTLDSGGRPIGWTTASPAQTVDVPVTLDEHVGVPIVFGVQTLAKTIRRLFEETAPQALYALGGYFVNKLAALLTASNYNAYAATSVGGGATTLGSNQITVSSTANMYPGQEIAHANLPSPCYVSSIVNATTALLTQKATASGTTLTFTLGGGRIPTTYATYVKALASFDTNALNEIAAALTTNEVPLTDRFCILNPAYFGKLSSDPAFATYFAAIRMPEILTEKQLPRVKGFQPIEAGWFPSSNNRVGFAGHKSAAIIKARLPQDFMSALGVAAPGSVTTVTAPNGLSVALVQYVNLQSNYAEWRPEIMIGAAVGDRRAGLLITSA